MHTGYSGTQLAFATGFLDSHRNTKLVTLQLGANDPFLLQRCTPQPSCFVAGLPGLLATIRTNLDTILEAIDATKFHGKVIVVNYYSLDYGRCERDGSDRPAERRDQGRSRCERGDRGRCLHGVPAGGCIGRWEYVSRGPLNTTPGNQATCDVHPTQSGAELLAQSVIDAYRSQSDGD